MQLLSKYKKNVLVGCEESDEVRSAFEAKGFNAVSCDEKENRNPNAKHYKGNIFDILYLGWDVMICFPPCTHLCVSGAKWFKIKEKTGEQKQGIDFFMKMIEAPIHRIAIENPIGIMSTIYRKPDQIIHPYYFGDEARKSTCLWLKNLPKLYHVKQKTLFDQHITHVDQGELYTYIDKRSGRLRQQPKWYFDALHLPKEERSTVRSKTFPGIAKAMAEQWSAIIEDTPSE